VDTDTHPNDRPRASNVWLMLVSAVVFLICASYTIAAAFLAPYPGIDLGPNWTVDARETCNSELDWCAANQAAIQPGDKLLVIGNLSYGASRQDRSRVIFGGYDPGDEVTITRRRGETVQIVQWHMVGPTSASRTRRLVHSLLAWIPFYISGTSVLILLQPRDIRWRLLLLFSYVAAVWLAAGMCSRLTVAYASPVQHALAWIGAAIFLHLHLTIPSPLLRRYLQYLPPFLYMLAGAFATLELFQRLPAPAFNVGLLMGFAGSAGVLIFRLFARPSAPDRLAIRLMLVGMGLTLGPGIALAVIPGLLGTSPAPGSTLTATAFAIALLPCFYGYAIYKRYLDTLEFRANRLLSAYSFVAVYATALTVVFLIANRWVNLPSKSLFFSLAVSTILVIAALLLHPRFDQLAARLAYGTAHDPDDILRVFASRIPAALTMEALAQLLADEITPSLLIRQSALYLLTNGTPTLIYAKGVELDESPQSPQWIQRLLVRAGRYQPPVEKAPPARDWVRLAIPLEIRKETLGIWLFGRRDPDDYYPQKDITLLTTLAGQVAVTIENAWMYEETRQRVLEQKTISHITSALNTLDFRDAIPMLAQSLRDVTGCDVVSVALINAVQEQFVVVAVEPPSPFLALGDTAPLSDNAVLESLMAGRPHLTTDLSVETACPLAQAMVQAGVRSRVALPLFLGGRIIGALHLSSHQPDIFEERQLPVLQQVANALSSAVENSRLFQAERQQRELAETLERAAAIVSSTLKPEEVLDRILEQVEQVVAGSTSNIILIDDGLGRPARWRGYNRLGVPHPPTVGPLPITRFPSLAKMVQSGEPVVISDTATDPTWIKLDGREWLRSYVAAPIRVRDRTVGFLNVNGTQPDQFTPADAQRLGAFAAHAAAAIENAYLYQEVLNHAGRLEQRVQERTAELRAQYARLEAILGSTSDGIVVTNAQGKIIQTNSVAQTWLTQTLSPADATRLEQAILDLARQANSAVGPQEQSRTALELTGLDLELTAALIPDPERADAFLPGFGEFKLRQAQTSARSVDPSSHRAAQGQPMVVVSIHDVSHLNALNRMKSRFVSNVSHELRTPITAIKLYIALLQRTSPEDGKWDRYLDALAQGANQQARLVEDILQLSRIDSGRMELKPRPTALNALAQAATSDYQALAQTRGLTLAYHPAEPGPVALVDPTRMTQVLSNLVDNAIQFTPEGGRVTVYTGQEATEGRTWATATVADTGMGIPEDELPHIFERFFRGEWSRTMQISGTGLGLALVDEIVALHGGHVTVKSEIDKGTVFTVWLPLVEGQD